HAAVNVILEPCAAKPHDSFAFAEHVSRGNRADEHDKFGIDQLDMASQERQARRRFLRRGIAVVGRSPVQHIGNVNILFSVKTDRREHLVEQFPGAPYEGKSRKIFVPPRRLAYEENARAGYTVGKYGVGRMLLESAA